MNFFKLKIIERLPKERIDEGEIVEFYEDYSWQKHEYQFDLNHKQIETFQSIKVYIDTDTYEDSVRVEFTNGSYVYLAYSIEKFKINILPRYEEALKSMIDNEHPNLNQ